MNYKYLFLSLILLCITMSGYSTPQLEVARFTPDQKIEYKDSLVYEKNNFEILTRRIHYALMVYMFGHIGSFEEYVDYSGELPIPIITYDKETSSMRWISNDEVKTIHMDSLKSIKIILDNNRLKYGLYGIIEVEFKEEGDK